MIVRCVAGRERIAWAFTVVSAFAVLSFSGSRVGMISFSLMMALLAFQMLDAVAH
eukprot:gene3694-biopygen3033